MSDNGLAFTAIAEIAGPFWSGRALGAQNTSQHLTGAIAAPLFGRVIGVAGFPAAFAICALFPLAAIGGHSVDSRRGRSLEQAARRRPTEGGFEAPSFAFDRQLVRWCARASRGLQPTPAGPASIWNESCRCFRLRWVWSCL